MNQQIEYLGFDRDIVPVGDQPMGVGVNRQTADAKAGRMSQMVTCFSHLCPYLSENEGWEPGC